MRPFIVGVVLVQLAGCAQQTANVAPAPEAAPAIDMYAVTAVPLDRTPVKPAVSAPVAEPVAKGAPVRTFGIEADGMPARDFFQGLVSGTGYSVIFSPEFTGPLITASLQNVSLEQAMTRVADLYGFSIELSGNIFSISAPGIQTRIYHIDYLALSRQGSSRTNVTSGQISSSDSSSNIASDNASFTKTSGSGTTISTQNTSQVWDELQLAVDSIIDRSRGELAILSPESGALMVRARASAQRDIREFLRIAHGTFHGEVLIEAKIIEVNLDDSTQVGVNWGGLNKHASGSDFYGIVGGNNALSNGTSALANSALNIGVGNGLTGFASAAAGGALVLSIDHDDFQGVFEFLQAQGDIKVLSSPRVATLNNQKAVIKVGTDEFFVTGISNNTTTGNNAVTNTEIELTPFFSGVALDVTPRIYGDEEVILHVHPSVSEVTDGSKEIIIQDQVQRLPLATSNLRESDSVIRARSGQIVVIGGLIREQESEQEFSAPFFGKIPVLKHLFGQSRTVSARSELIILLKPTIVESWRDRDAEYLKAKERLGGAIPQGWLE